MSFIKNKENFTCEKCGHEILGDGYTNHCSKCLWSKHVDVDPGDRLAGCGGMMKPVGIEKNGDEIKIIHKCQTCGHVKKNKTGKEDNDDVIIQLSKKHEVEE